MDTESNDGCSGVPTTPSRNSNRHELLWENFPNCTDAHWEEIGRTPNVGPRPRNYSKAVNLSDRRRTVSEGRDWFDDFENTDFDKVFVDDKFVPFRDASSQVSGDRFKEVRNWRYDVSAEEVAPGRESCNRERKRSVGPRVLDSVDFSSSSDDVLHGPVFYMGSGKTSLISNSPDRPSSLNNRDQLTKDISRAAKQLKYFEQPRRDRGQRKGSLSSTTKSSKTGEYLNGYTAVDWPVYEGLGAQIDASGVDGGKLGKGIFRISNKAHVAKVAQPTRATRNLLELPATSDEDYPDPNEVFASSRDSYEESTSKNSYSQETSKLKDMFAWNICFDPTPMKSDGARFATGERKDSLPSTARQGGTRASATQYQPGTSRKKWVKTSKNTNLECSEEPLASTTLHNGQPNLLDFAEDNYGTEAVNLCREKDSQRYLRSVRDQSYRKPFELERINDPFSRTRKPCELKEMQKTKYSSCERRSGEYPVIVCSHSNSLRRDYRHSRCGNCHHGKNSDQHSDRNDRFDSKRRARKQESKCTVHGKEGFRDHHRANYEISNDTCGSLEGSWNEEACRYGGCVSQCCPLAGCLPILLSHGCNHGVLTNYSCKSKICTCCSEAKPRCLRLLKPCSVHGKPKNTRVHSSEELEPDFEGGYDEVDREVDSLVGVDSIDGKTYFVSEKSKARDVRRCNSQNFMKATELPVLVSYRRSVDTATEVLQAEQKGDMSSQTEPTALDCSTQVKPVVRHSVTQYSTKVNHHNKDTQCVTRTSSVCTQAVVFEPLDHGTQFPERKENHHKQTQCNFATGRKSVQANLKHKPNLFGFSYGTGASYRTKDEYFPEDCSFKSSHSSYLLPPDLSTDLTVVAPKSAPSSAVVAVAAAKASADFCPQEDTRKEPSEQPARKFEVSPVTLRCSVLSVRPVVMFPNEETVGVSARSGEDCVDEGRQRTLSLRNSSEGNSAIHHSSRSRGKSVSFPTDIARFFEHPNSPRRLLSSDDSCNSDDIKNNVQPLQYGGYMNGS